MRSTRKTRISQVWAEYNPHAVTLFGIHAVELIQTAAFHVGDWSGLHTALAVGMVASAVNVIKGK